MTYVLLYAGLLLCGFVSRGKSSLRNALYYVCLLVLFFVAGFRYKVGCDWSGYLNIFELSRRYEFQIVGPQSREAGFWVVNKLLNDFGLDYPYINVIASGVFFLGFNALARRQPDPLGVLVLAFPILILNLAMSGIRQAIALGFLCIAYNAFVDRRLVRFALVVAIATTFHSSAIAFMMLAPFVRGQFSRQRVALGAALALPGLYALLTSQTMELYQRRYVGTGLEAGGAPFRTGLLALTGVAFLWLLDSKWRAQSISDYKLVKIFSYAMVAVFPLALYSSVSGDRIGYYLCPIQLIILARLPLLIKGPHSTMVAFVPYAAGALFLLVWTTLSSLFERCYDPYQIWW